MSTQTTALTSRSTEFHYITTVQTRDGVLNTRDGLLTVPTGFTRAECFTHLLGQLKAEYGSPISVLYFALEPNQL
ncbi:hypothetical protein [Streptomyces sp. NRRL S-118]|uniref:hypothetical protein n=1 Tax=Streptomyces sp. NRRL S-118 TaxID=1463881 RepID=UPI0004C76E3F|nr:hypothetical protein [Streptomyces sp. NRRL S-118]